MFLVTIFIAVKFHPLQENAKKNILLYCTIWHRHVFVRFTPSKDQLITKDL